jgi:hypothetical protein
VKKSSVEAIVEKLNQHQVQYLIVGGLAVVAHGYMRFTADVDLLISVDEQNLRRVIAALQALDYRPRAPVAIEDLISAEKRRQWAREKNMTVFSLFSPQHGVTEVDLLIEPPIDFAAAYANAMHREVAPGIVASFCGIDELIKLKEIAGRPRDQLDVAELRRLGKPEERS